MATATRTVLFTDLADYTAQVARADTEGLHQLLQGYEKAVYPIVAARGGRVVKNIGDSFMCLFESATDALRAALGILADARQGGVYRIRVAVNTGDVEEIDGDAFGDAVNLASRILQKTPPGETWFGAGTRICMSDTDVAWEPMGRFTLKGIAGEQECFRLVPEDQAWLPFGIVQALHKDRLVRLRPGEEVPQVPPDAVILFEGFKLGAHELDQAMRQLPVLDPANLYFAVYTISIGDRQMWCEPGSGLVIGTPQAINAAIEDIEAGVDTMRDTGSLDLSDTMYITDLRLSDMEVAICGLALPSVPFSEVLAGYSYDLETNSGWSTHAENPVLRIDVRAEGVWLQAVAPGVTAGGRLLEAGESVALSDWTDVSSPAGEVQFRPLEGQYRGVLVSSSVRRLTIKKGQTVELGRKPNPPGLAFRSGRGRGNLMWCSGARAAQARANGFTLDRVLVGRRQAAISLELTGAQITPLHTECPTYLLREDGLERIEQPEPLSIGDLVVAGTTLVTLRPPA